MVVEHFGDGEAQVAAALRAVGERFRAMGRLIPHDSGVSYVASWMTADGSCCYQLMESPSRGALDGWMQAWGDLVRLEVQEVKTSADFWSGRVE